MSSKQKQLRQALLDPKKRFGKGADKSSGVVETVQTAKERILQIQSDAAKDDKKIDSGSAFYRAVSDDYDMGYITVTPSQSNKIIRSPELEVEADAAAKGSMVPQGNKHECIQVIDIGFKEIDVTYKVEQPGSVSGKELYYQWASKFSEVRDVIAERVPPDSDSEQEAPPSQRLRVRPMKKKLKVQDDDGNAIIQQMFLASTCGPDKDSNLHGRIFAFPMVNQKVTEPFEILQTAGESNEHLMKGHENIELHLVSETSAIITGYQIIEEEKAKKKPKDGEEQADDDDDEDEEMEQEEKENQPENSSPRKTKMVKNMYFMIYKIDFKDGLKEATWDRDNQIKIKLKKHTFDEKALEEHYNQLQASMPNVKINIKEKIEQKQQQFNDYPYNHTRKQLANNHLRRSVISRETLYVVPQHDKIIAVDLRDLDTKKLDENSIICEQELKSEVPKYGFFNQNAYQVLKDLKPQDEEQKKDQKDIPETPTHNKNEDEQQSQRDDINEERKFSEIVIMCEKEVVYLELNRKVEDMTTTQQEAEQETTKKAPQYEFKVNKQTTLKINSLELEGVKSFEARGFLVTILDQKIFYNLEKESGGSVIFDQQGEIMMRMKANIWPAISYKNRFFVFDKLEQDRPRVDLIGFDKFNILKNQNSTVPVLCLSNICAETNSIFYQRENGVFGEHYYDEPDSFSEYKTEPQDLNVYKTLLHNKDFVVINIDPTLKFEHKGQSQGTVATAPEGRVNKIMVISKSGSRKVFKQNNSKHNIDQIFLTNSNFLIMKTTSCITTFKLTETEMMWVKTIDFESTYRSNLQNFVWDEDEQAILVDLDNDQIICLDDKLDQKYPNKHNNKRDQAKHDKLIEDRSFLKGKQCYFLAQQLLSQDKKYAIVDSDKVYNLEKKCMEKQFQCDQLFIADELPQQKYVVSFQFDKETIKIYSWDNFEVIMELKLPYKPEILDNEAKIDVYRQHPEFRNTFQFREYKINLNDLMDMNIIETKSETRNGFTLFCLQGIINDRIEICPGILEYFRNFCLLPSNFNILSLLADSITDKDEYKVVDFIKTKNYPLITDESGHLLNQLLKKQHFAIRHELGQHFTDNHIEQQFTEKDINTKLTDSSPWITDMITSNCQKILINEMDEQTGWHVKKEMMLGKINGNEFDIATFTSESATVTKEMLKDNGLVEFKSNSKKDKGESSEDIDYKFIELICSPVKFGRLGSDSLGELFETFLQDDINVDLAFNTFFKEFIDSFWNKNYTNIVMMLFLTRVIPLIAVQLLLLYPCKQMFIVALCITALNFFYELKSLIMFGFTKHFEQFMNYVDFIGHLSGLIWIVCMIQLDFTCHEDADAMHVCIYGAETNKGYVDSRLFNFINLTWTFCITMRATDLFSTLNSTRQLFMILKVSAQDITAFMIITIYILFVFTVIKQYQGLINGITAISFADQMGIVLTEALGGFEVPNVGHDKVVAAWLIFILLQIVTSIIVLNTLIAILGDSYDNVMNEQVAYDTKQKVELLIELNDFYKSDSKNKKDDKEYIIMIRYVTNEMGGGAWEGKIKMITREIKNLNTATDEKFKKMKQLQDENQAKIMEQFAQIKQALSENKN